MWRRTAKWPGRHPHNDEGRGLAATPFCLPTTQWGADGVAFQLGSFVVRRYGLCVVKPGYF